MDRHPKKRDNYDLVIVGSGSAAFAGAIKAAETGARIAMIERGVLGGTCVNAGCVPSKTLIRAAEARYRAAHLPFRGLESHAVSVSYETLIREKDDLVSSLREARYREVLRSHEEMEFIEGEGSFLSGHEVRAGSRVVKGDYFLIATGASPMIPPITGLGNTAYLTSTTALELKSLPPSLMVIGGRYIGLELAQMFQRLGTEVTLLQRSPRILPTEDPDLTDALTRYLTGEGMTVLTGVQLNFVSRTDSFLVNLERGGKTESRIADQLLLATGRTPNTGGLGLERCGVRLNSDGSVPVNAYGQTSISHIYAAGDVTGEPAFVYTAAYEGNLAAENALNGNARKRDFGIVPYVIFTDPQVAGVGLNETRAKNRGIEVEVAKLALDNVPRALAARDTRGFIKLIRQRGTDQLAGASVLAPEGSELLMEISMAMKYKIPISEIAAMFHPYLTLGEAVKLAAQTFDKDVEKLSCCAA